MTLGPPGKPSLWHKNPAVVLEYEIAQEKASALGRHGRALEAALKVLADFDTADPPRSGDVRSARGTLVASAADALWQFIVVREACGMRDAGPVMRMYKVPTEVRDRMGVFAPKRG